jgi:hypothetical protein
VASFTDVDLERTIPGVQSNSIGAQLWCLCGARESYATAIEMGQWVGFSCSISDPSHQATVLGALTDASKRVNAALSTTNTTGHDLALDLLEHEVQHHGQLIRFVYSNSLAFPPSWNSRYTV